MTRKLTEEDRRKLREAAEARLARTQAPARSHPSTSALLHELQVHQIELEMQNDELQRDQAELEESHERFVDLYDFAPVGYLTVSPSGVVQEANLTAASMLGVERRNLPGRPFASFVERGDADRWHLFLRSVLRGSEHQECDLAIRLGDDSVFDAHLACRRRGSPGRTPPCASAFPTSRLGTGPRRRSRRARPGSGHT